MPAWLKDAFGDRIQVNSILIVLSFVSVLSLESQSAASWPTYLLGLLMIVSVRAWNDVFDIRYFHLIGALVGYLVLSGLWTSPFSPMDTLRMLLRGMLIVLFVVACAECELRGQLKRWLGRSLAIIATAAASAALYVHIQFPDYFPGPRLYGLGQLDNPIIAGMVYAASLVFMLDLVVHEQSNRWRATALFSVGLLLVAIALTGSRSAWMATGAGVLVYLLAVSVRDRQRFVVTTVSLAVILGCGLAALIVSDTTRDVILPRGESYRFDIWAEAVNRVLEQGRLLIGLGIGAPDDISVRGITFEHPHSLYLSVFYQGGLIGLALLLAVVVVTTLNLLRFYADRDAKLALGLFAVALVGYLLDGHELIDKVSDMWFLFWLPVALCLGLLWRTPVPDRDEP